MCAYFSSSLNVLVTTHAVCTVYSLRWNSRAQQHHRHTNTGVLWQKRTPGIHCTPIPVPFALLVNWANSVQLKCKRILMKFSHTHTRRHLRSLYFACSCEFVCVHVCTRELYTSVNVFANTLAIAVRSFVRWLIWLLPVCRRFSFQYRIVFPTYHATLLCSINSLETHASPPIILLSITYSLSLCVWVSAVAFVKKR